MIGWIILAAIVILLAVILIRTALFTPKKEEIVPLEEISFDGDAAIHSMSELIQCKTVSYYDHSLEDDAEFEKLIGKLPGLFPEVFRVCSFDRLPDRALLFRWKGCSEGDAAVFMAHYDVVPVVRELWQEDPFSAVIKDGVMWGRGTIDTKVTFNGVLSAANNLIAQGFTPEHDVYFAFSGGEEVSGPGASNIVQWFSDHNVKLSMVLDEGGAVVQDVFPGVHQPCAVVGIAEKGMMDLKFEINSDGGHASAPAPHTPVGKLSMACTKVEANPFKAHFTAPVLKMFDTMGRHSTFLYRMIFANLWCFGPILDNICKKGGGELNALVRTTVAFTQMEGSSAPNVIPPHAEMVANLRLNPMDTIDSATERIRGLINDDSITLSVMDGENPSPISSTDCVGWQRIVNACHATWPDALVSPYLMVQCSDSRHYGCISDKVYRFCAIALTAEERHMIHGNNERLGLETIKSAVAFFMRVMKQC